MYAEKACHSATRGRFTSAILFVSSCVDTSGKEQQYERSQNPQRNERRRTRVKTTRKKRGMWGQTRLLEDNGYSYELVGRLAERSQQTAEKQRG